MGKKEYIEREAALRANCYFCSAHLKDDSPCDEKCADYMKFMEIPAADVRPVVLCRDCKHNQGTKTWIDHDITADCMNGHGYPPLDWFCADGEKREES